MPKLSEKYLIHISGGAEHISLYDEGPEEAAILDVVSERYGEGGEEDDEEVLGEVRGRYGEGDILGDVSERYGEESGIIDREARRFEQGVEVEGVREDEQLDLDNRKLLEPRRKPGKLFS